MGQRHQIFVIARVRSKGETTGRRRCVAAYHHQWCYGRTALQCLSRFVKLVSQPDNTALVRRDIANVDGNWGEVLAEAEKETYVPCPFIAYLLQLAWNINFDDMPVYSAGVSFDHGVLPALMNSSDGDNNDGITIVDVTDPTNPSYCFNDICGPPLTAEYYVRKYYPQTVDLATISDDEDEDEFQGGSVATERLVVRTISALQDVPLMSIDALAEAWPQDYTLVREDMIAVGAHVPDTLPSNDPLTGPPTVFVPSQPSVQSLADISLRQAVIHAVNEGNIEPIQDFLSMGQRDVILGALCNISPLPPAGAKLLNLVIGREQPAGVRNLSAVDLSPSAVLSLVTVASTTLYKLDLTGNKRVTVHDLVHILSTAHGMRQLIIFDCPLISDEEIYGLLASSPKSVYNLEFIGHGAFFRRARDMKPSCPYTPTFTCVISASMDRPYITSLPYFTPSRLLRSIYTLLQPVAASRAAATKLEASKLTYSHKAKAKLAELVSSSRYMFTTTAVSHAAFTTWHEEAVLVTDAIRVAEGQKLDPCGLRANTQRITLIPQTSTSFDGWLLLVRPPGYHRSEKGQFAIARKRQQVSSADANMPPAANVSTENAPLLDLEVLSLSEFVDALKEEGRPAPPAEDVTALAGIIETAFPGSESRFDSAGAAQFLKNVMIMSERYSY